MQYSLWRHEELATTRKTIYSQVEIDIIANSLLIFSFVLNISGTGDAP